MMTKKFRLPKKIWLISLLEKNIDIAEEDPVWRDMEELVKKVAGRYDHDFDRIENFEKTTTNYKPFLEVGSELRFGKSYPWRFGTMIWSLYTGNLTTFLTQDKNGIMDYIFIK